MEKKDFYLYIDGRSVPVSGEVCREYCRAEDKERYFMGRLRKRHKGFSASDQTVALSCLKRGLRL